MFAVSVTPRQKIWPPTENALFGNRLYST